MYNSIKFYNEDIPPISWDMEEIRGLDFQFRETYKINSAFDDYHHDRYKDIICNETYMMPKRMPKFVNEILKLSIFEKYKIAMAGLHKMKPGMILPEHSDPYIAFAQRNEIENIEKITRYVIFLEDYKTGHFIQISDNVYTRYRAGDFVKWSGYTSHAAYNLGTEDRYTLQITCS